MTDSKIKILIVDDDDDDRSLVRNILARAGSPFLPICAESLSDGIAACDHDHIAVVLLDLMLVETQGLETVKRFRAAVSGIPIIVLSGLADEQIALKAVEHGAQDYLSKDDVNYQIASRCIHYAIQRQDLQSQLMRVALTDPVTSLPNRTKLNEELAAAMTKAGRDANYCFAIAFIDLDDFKVVNDIYGHSTGDRLLSDFAGRLQRSLGTYDSVARFGGDEFVVLLSDVGGNKDFSAFLSKLEIETSKPFIVDGRDHHITTSIGLVLYDNEYNSPGEMLRDADTAMYQSKRDRKAGYRWYCRSMRDEAVTRLGMESQLRAALEKEQFSLHYQPIVDLSTEKVVRFEALLRWNSPIRGNVPPAQFIPLAEASGMIVPIGSWVLRAACLQLAEWQQRFGESLKIAINVSPTQLSDNGFTADVFDAIYRSRVNTDCVELEVTESTVMKNPIKARSALTELSTAGVRISIDDFGTGYSSLAQLYEYNYDTLKIDRSFVASMLRDGHDFVKAILALAFAMELDVVAEGVECAEQASRLRELGCHFGQGYLFGKPMNSDDVEEYLASQLARNCDYATS
ncbi:MAG: EAL domain-containing protein [Planctomycetales bacterium]|nr:EAL domain-containing protein [Planctomycetales bacterium]